MDVSIAGFVALGALIVGLFAWLRQDIRELREQMNNRIDRLNDRVNGLNQRINGLNERINELRERLARIEGLLEAVFMRRDLTPFPEPSPSGGQPDETRAA